VHPEAARRRRWPAIPTGSRCDAGVYAGPCPGRHAASCDAVGCVYGDNDEGRLSNDDDATAGGGGGGDGDAGMVEVVILHGVALLAGWCSRRRV